VRSGRVPVDAGFTEDVGEHQRQHARDHAEDHSADQQRPYHGYSPTLVGAREGQSVAGQGQQVTPVVKELTQSARVNVTVLICDVASGYVNVRNTASEIEELDFIHGAENHSHDGRRSDWRGGREH
jgi:hypothetical protein